MKSWHKPMLLTLILLLAFGLRVYRLEYQSLWWDEGYSIEISLKSLPQITLATAGDIHPPFYYYLLHFWLPFTGTSEFSVRFLSLAFGMLLVALISRVGLRLLGTRAGVLATLIATLSPLYVAYSQEARMYSLETLLGLSSAYLLFLLLQKREKAKSISWPLWLAYVVVTALSLYTDYFSGQIILFENAFVLGWVAYSIAKGSSQKARRTLAFSLWWVLSQLAIVVLYLPWLRIGVGQVTRYGYGVTTAPPLFTQIAKLWHSFNLGPALAEYIAGALLAAGAVIFIAGITLFLSTKPENRTASMENTLYLLAYLLVPFVAFLIIMRFRPFFHPRYLMVATPPYYLLLAVALETLWQRWKPAALLSLTVIVAAFAIAVRAYLFDPTFAKDDARSLMHFIHQEVKEDDLVLWETQHPFEYYYHGAALAKHLRTSLEKTPDELTKLAQGRKRIFWVTWIHAGTDPWHLVPFLLEKYGYKWGERLFTGYSVVWYVLERSTSFSLGQLQDTKVKFEDQVTLTGVAFGGDDDKHDVYSGDRHWITLRWHSLRKLDEDLKFFVYLRDKEGRIVGQDDRLLLNAQGWRTPYWEDEDITMGFADPQVRPGIPPGDYQIEVGVYVEKTQRRLGIVGGSGPNIIGSIKVLRPTTPPSINSLTIGRLTKESFGELDLLGYDVAAKGESGLPTLSDFQGESLPLTLFWQARVKPSADHIVALELIDANGHRRSQWSGHPVDNSYPTSKWEAGEVVADMHDFLIAPDVPEGEYRLVLTVDDAPPFPLASVRVRERERLFAPPPIQHPVAAKLDAGIELLGFDVAPADAKAPETKGFLVAVAPGEAIDLTLYWRAIGKIANAYTVFTHLIDAKGGIWGQKDNPPQGGAAPTTSWVEDQVVIDKYRIQVKGEAPPGEYQIEVGMYRPETGKRSLVDGKDDRILLGKVMVVKP